MAWGEKTFDDARDLADYVQRQATSKHVSAIAVNAAGTGYTVGDVLGISHAGAHLDLSFVVATVNGGGGITGIARIEKNGAFANRLTAATPTAGFAGTGYAVGDIVGVLGGTTTSPAKVEVTAVGGGGAVTTLGVFEGGGHYSSNPSNGATTDATIGLGTGTGLKLDMTFSGLIGTTGIAATGGTGTGATFNLTLTDGGWTVLKSSNNFSINSIDDEKEIVLRGTGGAGSALPHVGIRSFSDGGGPNRVGLSISPMTAYDSLLDYDDQPNILNPVPATTGGQYVQLNPAGSNDGIIYVTPRWISAVVTAVGVSVTADHYFGCGLLDPPGTTEESPFPCAVLASCSSIDVDFDATDESDISGPTLLYKQSSRDGPCYVWWQPTLSWEEIKNGETSGAGAPYTVAQDRGTFPIFKPRKNFTGTANKGNTVDDGPWSFHSTIGRADGGSATHVLKPTPDTGGEKQALLDVIVEHSLDVAGITDGGIDGRIPNVLFLSSRKADGSNMTPGTEPLFGNAKYRLFRNGARYASGYDLFAMKVGV